MQYALACKLELPAAGLHNVRRVQAIAPMHKDLVRQVAEVRNHGRARHVGQLTKARGHALDRATDGVNQKVHRVRRGVASERKRAGRRVDEGYGVVREPVDRERGGRRSRARGTRRPRSGGAEGREAGHP